MAKGLYQIFRTKAELDAFVRQNCHFARVYTLDDVTIALGRMGFTHEQFEQFRDTYAAVADEGAGELLEDAKTDKELWYSTECKDRELREYLGDLYAEREVRYR